ncbi:hypothetical protein LY76DRAFT_240236 [Colletotrichum caudatum]|nr:hypothetical protein LY76DRAFT_240236 [Colletotrichum caudatum]
MLRRPSEARRRNPRDSAPPITPAVSAVGRLLPGRRIEPSVTHQQHSPDLTVRELVWSSWPSSRTSQPPTCHEYGLRLRRGIMHFFASAVPLWRFGKLVRTPPPPSKTTVTEVCSYLALSWHTGPPFPRG